MMPTEQALREGINAIDSSTLINAKTTHEPKIAQETDNATIGNLQKYVQTLELKSLQESDNKETIADRPSMRKALECLRHTKPELPDLSYPHDAFQHFHHIHHRLGRWVQEADHESHRKYGYEGPWIENRWISHFQQELESNNYSLPDVFGPYIPIFIPWTDLWVNLTGKNTYPKDLVVAMKDLLREDVLYITVSQNADGFVGRCSEFSDLQSKFQITVLSAGGYGHVPIPLLMQPEIPVKIPLDKRNHLISYVGSNKNAPKNMRMKMNAQNNHYYYYGKKWREVMAQSKFSLCPRGYGRTSFHLMEALQMGLIPIQVYQDQSWLPYGNLMKNISYSVTLENLPDLISQLSNMPDSEIVAMEDQIVKLREDYFSFQGALKQIAKFMLNPRSSQLECQALPSDSGTGQKNNIRACS